MVHQDTTDTPVAVDERMDHLELAVEPGDPLYGIRRRAGHVLLKGPVDEVPHDCVLDCRVQAVLCEAPRGSRPELTVNWRENVRPFTHSWHPFGCNGVETLPCRTVFRETPTR